MMITTMTAVQLSLIFGMIGARALFYDCTSKKECIKPQVHMDQQIKIGVIHDGRLKEGYPILNEEPFISIMCGSQRTDRPNWWRETSLKDHTLIEETGFSGKSPEEVEGLFSEFSALHTMWKEGGSHHGYVYMGKMHYRSYLNLTAPIYDAKSYDYENSPNAICLFGETDLPEKQNAYYYKAWLKKTRSERMGYDSQNLKRIFREEEWDIVTAMPVSKTDMGGCGIFEQMLLCHGEWGQNPTMSGKNYALLIFFLEAGTQLYNWVTDTQTRFPKHSMEVAAISEKDYEYCMSCKGKDSPFSANGKILREWDAYVGLSKFLVKIGYLDKEKCREKEVIPFEAEGGIPYFKDLFIMSRDIFFDYMKCVTQSLQKIYTKSYRDLQQTDAADANLHKNPFLLYSQEPYRDDSSPQNRLLAFLGERMTGFFIHYYNLRADTKVGLVARAHYARLYPFLNDLYPTIEKNPWVDEMIPVFWFRREDPNDCVPVTREEEIERLAEQGYVFEKCIGYIFAPERANQRSYMKRFVCVRDGREELLGYAFRMLQEGANDLPDNDLLQVRYMKTGAEEIGLATFGRKDIYF